MAGGEVAPGANRTSSNIRCATRALCARGAEGPANCSGRGGSRVLPSGESAESNVTHEAIDTRTAPLPKCRSDVLCGQVIFGITKASAEQRHHRVRHLRRESIHAGVVNGTLGTSHLGTRCCSAAEYLARCIEVSLALLAIVTDHLGNRETADAQALEHRVLVILERTLDPTGERLG